MAGLEHVGDNRLREVHSSHNPHLKGLAKDCRIDSQKRSTAITTGIVCQRGYRGEFGANLIYGVGDGVGITHVGRHNQGRRAFRTNVPGDGLG